MIIIHAASAWSSASILNLVATIISVSSWSDNKAVKLAGGIHLHGQQRRRRRRRISSSLADMSKKLRPFSHTSKLLGDSVMIARSAGQHRCNFGVVNLVVCELLGQMFLSASADSKSGWLDD